MSAPDQEPVVAVLLIAHGSRQAAANDDLYRVAAALAGRGEYPIVEACFLELAEPDIPAGGARCADRGATRVLMVPYFLSAGVHLLRDLTAARDALAARHPGVSFTLGRPLGPHPLLDELVALRAREVAAAGQPPPAPHVTPAPPSCRPPSAETPSGAVL